MADTSLLDTTCYLSDYTMRGLEVAQVSKVSAMLTINTNSTKKHNITIPMTKEQIEKIETAKASMKPLARVSLIFSVYQLSLAQRLTEDTQTARKGTQFFISRRKTYQGNSVARSPRQLLSSKKKATERKMTKHPKRMIALTPLALNSIPDDYLLELRDMITTAIEKRTLNTIPSPSDMGSLSRDALSCWSCQDHTTGCDCEIPINSVMSASDNHSDTLLELEEWL